MKKGPGTRAAQCLQTDLHWTADLQQRSRQRISSNKSSGRKWMCFDLFHTCFITHSALPTIVIRETKTGLHFFEVAYFL